MLDPRDRISSSTFCSLVHATRRLGAEAEPGLRKAGTSSLEYAVLSQIVLAPGSTPAELGRLSGLTPQHLAGILARLEPRGLVSRQGQRGRGRATRVDITAAGMALLEAGWPVIADTGLAYLTDQQHRQLRCLLSQFQPWGRQDPDDLVVLVDDRGAAMGTAHRLAVHSADTPRHRAFSTHLRDASGRVLLTRRALHKKTWPGVWTNSACGHLRPGEDLMDAVLRRVPEELGVAPTDLSVALPEFTYSAVDASGIQENEWCPVLVGTIDADCLATNPDEVAEHAWVDWAQLQRAMRDMPPLFSPWSVLQVAALGDDPWQRPVAITAEGVDRP